MNFWPGSRDSTAIMASIFMRLHVANPRPSCDRFLRFIVRCFSRKKNNNNNPANHNAALHFMVRVNAVFAFSATALRQINRQMATLLWYINRGPTGSLLVDTMSKTIIIVNVFHFHSSLLCLKKIMKKNLQNDD